MHNGCLLLLAFVAVFQPIASYTERGLVDGRQQRCDYRTSVRDPGLNFHGTYRFNKPAVEDRRLNHREDTREVRRNEIREDNLRIASSSDTRLPDTSERDRNTLTRFSRNRIGNDAVQRRENRETRLVSSRRDERNREISRERLSRLQEIHQARFDSRRENSRLSDENRSQRIDNRVSVESQRNIRGNGISEATQRVRENQEARVEINRVMNNGATSLNDRRIARETIGRMDTRRSVSRIQRDRSSDREILGRRSNKGLRSLTTSGSMVYRAYENTRSQDRNDRRPVSSQRRGNEQRQGDSRNRLTIERNIPDAFRRVLDDRTSENLRDIQRIQRAHSTGNRDTENRVLLARAVRSADDLASQNDRSVSRIRRERAAENRRDLGEARNLVRTLSLERSAEYRNDFRSSDRILENRVDNHNVERETRQNIDSIRLAQIRNSNRYSCVFDRESSTEHRMTRMTRERSQESRRLAQNVESRAFRTERRGDGRQDVREAATQAFRAERIGESGRDARNIRAQSFRTNESQRDIRNIAVREFRIERTADSRRDVRNVAVRSVMTERSDESEQDDARNINSRLSRGERTIESRRDVREIGSRAFRSERTDESRQNYARNINSRLSRSERTSESRRDAREVGIGAFRTERTDASRRDEARVFRTERIKENRQRARNVEVRASRTVRADESRVAARDDGMTATNRHIESQSRSLDRNADSRRERQNNIRGSRIQERAHESRRNIRNNAFRTKAERTNIKRRAIQSLERETRSMGRERSMESRRSFNERHNPDSRMFTMERRERTDEDSRHVQNVHKDIRSVDAREWGVESRRMNLVRSGNVRATDRLSKRDSIESTRTDTLQHESRRDTQRKSDRNNLARRQGTESRRSFDTDFARKRDFQNMLKNHAQTENETKTPINTNWQYIFYALQGFYIWGLLMQLNKGSVEKKTRVSWWPAHQHLIKVD